MTIYAIDPKFFSTLGIDPAQRSLSGAHVHIASTTASIDAWTNQAAPPWLDERLVVVDGLLDAAATSCSIAYDGRGAAFSGFADYAHPITLTSRIATIIPLHGRSSPWLQSPAAYITDGKESNFVFRVRYEDSPAGAPATLRDQDLFFRMEAEIVSEEQTYPPVEGGDDATRTKVYCISLLDINRNVVQKRQITAPDVTAADASAIAFLRAYNAMPSTVFPAATYALARGRC